MNALDPAGLDWYCLPFEQLGAGQLYRILQQRCAVFVVEQHCPYLDPDGKDLLPGVQHLWAEHPEHGLLAYLRLLPPGISFAEASIGRVITTTAARGSGLGHALMRRALEQAQSRWPGQPIRIGAQAHLQAFYSRHGFVTASAEYLEDGIPHVEMLRDQPA